MKIIFESDDLKGIMGQMTTFFWDIANSAHSSKRDASVPETKSTSRRKAHMKSAEKVEEPKKGSRRKGNGSAKPVPPKPSPKEPNSSIVQLIADRDVSKAASDAAMELTPAVVTNVLGEFGVSTVGDLDQNQRREFIDKLNDMQDEPDDDI